MIALLSFGIGAAFGFVVCAMIKTGHREEPQIETPEQARCEHYFTEDDGA